MAWAHNIQPLHNKSIVFCNGKKKVEKIEYHRITDNVKLRLFVEASLWAERQRMAKLLEECVVFAKKKTRFFVSLIPIIMFFFLLLFLSFIIRLIWFALFMCAMNAQLIFLFFCHKTTNWQTNYSNENILYDITYMCFGRFFKRLKFYVCIKGSSITFITLFEAKHDVKLLKYTVNFQRESTTEY